MGILITWIILSALCGVYASSKGRSGMGYTFLSMLLSPVIGFIVVAIAGEKKEQNCYKARNE